MFLQKHIIQIYLLIAIILNIILCQRLPNEFLETWGEKPTNEKTPNFSDILDSVEKHLVSEEEYSLEEDDIIPFGFFKQTINGVIYRLLLAVKKAFGHRAKVVVVYSQDRGVFFQINGIREDKNPKCLDVQKPFITI